MQDVVDQLGSEAWFPSTGRSQLVSIWNRRRRHQAQTALAANSSADGRHRRDRWRDARTRAWQRMLGAMRPTG
jgi:hypothetical protein